jgi:hypothetical protein
MQHDGSSALPSPYTADDAIRKFVLGIITAFLVVGAACAAEVNGMHFGRWQTIRVIKDMTFFDRGVWLSLTRFSI